jgi:hypothetical protein
MVYGTGGLLALGALVLAGLVYEAFRGTFKSLPVGRFLTDLFEKHKFVRRFSILWMIALVTWSHVIVYDKMVNGEPLTSQDATVFGLTVGLVATLTAWYMQVRKHEDQKD